MLLTNTSALSITEMAADLQHPERVVGMHFFNPVAQMPLVEIIQAAKTDDAALATAFAMTKKLRKTAVLVADRPGFVVNRLLILLMGKIVEAVENGTSVEVADRAVAPLGLPMPPFALFDLVGPAVGLHVLTSLREDLGDRFPSPRPPAHRRRADPRRPRRAEGPAQARRPGDPAGLRHGRGGRRRGAGRGRRPRLRAHGAHAGDRAHARRGRGREPVADRPVHDPGAGWGFHLGGITPYLDRTGYSEKVLGRRFLPDGAANVPAPSRA